MKKKENLIIKLLVSSNFFIYFSQGLFTPILAIFVVDKIQGGNLEIVGYSTAIYFVSRVGLVVPFSKLMDRIKGEKDEFIFLIIGTFGLSIINIFFIYSTEPWHIYLIQFLMGAFFSMALPAWRIIFTNHLDKNSIGYDWSLNDVFMGTATGLSAAIGALIANRFGFDALFVIITITGIIGSIMLLFLNHEGKLFLKKSHTLPLGKTDLYKIDGGKVKE